MVVIARSFFLARVILSRACIGSSCPMHSSLHPFETATPIQKPPKRLHRQGLSRSIGLIFRSDHRFTCQILTTGFGKSSLKMGPWSIRHWGLISGLCCQSRSLVKRFSESKAGALRSFHFLRLCHISHVTMSSHAAALLMHCTVCAPWLDTPDTASPSTKPLGAGA